jgi:hypothetical protein
MTQAANLAVAGGHVQSPGYFITSGTVNAGAANPLSGGTAVSYTDIPSWVKKITIMFYNASTSGASNMQIQFGTGATPTYTTSGYQGTALASTAAGNSASNSTTGFILNGSAGAALLNGIGTFTNVFGNTWAGTISMGQSDSARLMTTSAGIALGAALTAIRVTMNGTDTFDAGSINILYEG